MKITREQTQNPDSDIMDAAASSSGVEYAYKNERIVFQVCPFCDYDAGPKYARERKSSWFMGGGSPGGFLCVMCDETYGPYQVFVALGCEIESSKSSQAVLVAMSGGGGRVAPLGGSNPKKPPPPTPLGNVAAAHKSSVALLCIDPAGEPVRKYLTKRGIMPSDPDEYMQLESKFQTLGAWKYGDGKFGVAFWYFDPFTKVPIYAKARFAEETIYDTDRRLMRWPVGGEHKVPYRAHLFDPALGEIIVTEGETDAETFAMHGLGNVMSTPDGARTVTALRPWVLQCRRVFSALDYDAEGFVARAKLIDLLPQKSYDMDGPEPVMFYDVRFKNTKGPGFHKDANEAATREGDEYVFECYDRASKLGQCADFKRVEMIRTGQGNMDTRYYGLMLGGYSHWSGKPGAGKTTLMWSIMISAQKANRKRCAYISLEEEVSASVAAFCASASGISPSSLRAVDSHTIDQSAMVGKLDSVNEAVYFAGTGEDWLPGMVPNYDQIIAVLERVASESRGSLVVIDNYSILRNVLTTPSGARKKKSFLMTDFAAASQVASDLLRLAIKYNCHIALINHMSGSGSAYGKARLDPLADLALKVSRKGRLTVAAPEKVRAFLGDAPVTLQFRQAANGLLEDAGYVSKKVKYGEEGDDGPSSGGTHPGDQGNFDDF